MTTISQITAAPVESLSPGVNVDRQIKFLRKVIINMTSKSVRKIMIGGDTGIGKTSFVKQFARMLGMPIVIIEIPHIVEEELVNIPYIIYDNKGDQSGVVRFELEKADDNGVKDIKVVLARSYLATQLESINKIGDAEYQKYIEQLDSNTKNLVDIYTQKYPDDIRNVRKMYNRILFFDEYFRQSTPTIRNILRNVLNGQIGNDKIPPGTYTMYASNLSDSAHGALDKQMGNEEYQQVDFEPPTAKEWLDYTIGQSKGKIQWHPDVVKAFEKTMQDTAVSYKDADTKIRTSPRRWSDIMIYINSLYPFETPREAGIAEVALSRQFQDDQGKRSPVYQTLELILDELIRKSSVNAGWKNQKIPKISASDWRDVLLQNVMVKQKAGEFKKYIPVIVGLPGIGKTTIQNEFEKPPYNLRLIKIDASTLTADSLTGMPITKLTDKEGNKLSSEKMQTYFSKPSLYMEIENRMKAAREGYKKLLRKREEIGNLGNKTADEVYEEFESQPYKYVIFFDEINRVKNVRVFNSLRRLILEKEFNNRFKLPSDAIVISAMNPSDIGNSTIGLTDHFRDAIEIIDVEADWNILTEYLKNQIVPQLKKLEIKPTDDAIDIALKIIEDFPTQFSDKELRDDKGKVLKTNKAHEFYINVGGVDRVYMSPRAYEDTFRILVTALDGDLKEISRMNPKPDDAVVNNKLTDSVTESFMDYFNNLFTKGQMEPIGFEDQLKKYISSKIDIKLEAERTTAGIGGMLDLAINGDTPLKDNFDFLIYMDNFVPSEFSNEFDEYLNKIIQDADVSENNIESKIDFFVGRGNGSFYQIAKEINDAVKEKNLETNILDQVALSADKFFKQINIEMSKSNFDENTIEQLVQNYFEIVDKVLVS